jgi:hypothetical protein
MTIAPLVLSLSDSAFDRLHKAADKNTVKCSVVRSELAALLRDHSALLAKVEEAYIEVEMMP